MTPTGTFLKTIRTQERIYTVDISNRKFVWTYKMNERLIQLQVHMEDIQTTDQCERHRRISGAIQNSRDIAFHQDRSMQGEIW